MNIKSTLESILFIANKPLSISDLGKLTAADKKEVEDNLNELISEYNQKGRGINIIRNGKEVQMVTVGENHNIVEEFIKNELTGEMTRPQLETLTIIAYRGPVTKDELEQVRGVNCSLILRNLMIRGLVESSEDKKMMRIYYQVTLDFIRYLGLDQINQLPDYDRLSKSDILEKLLASAVPAVAETQPSSNKQMF